MKHVLLLGSMLFALAPATARAQVPGPWVAVAPPPPPAPPPQPHEESRPILGLAISGAVMLGVSYLVHALLVSPLAGCDIDSCQSAWGDFRLLGAIPLGGPWAQLALKPPSSADVWGPYLVIDGVLQSAGLLMLVLGFAIRETRTVMALDSNGPSFAVVPSMSPDGGGLRAIGRF
ncbi:MAG: hypothetical protein H6719_18130 [Sandaracinaceae bacterium]|nr:hypothetical protein [Sandaracinaceae bacterium]